MRIDLNLAILETARERYGVAWAVPVIVLGMVGLILLSSMALGNFRRYRRVHRAVVEVEGREHASRERASALRQELEQPRLRQLSREMEFINSLVEQRYLSVAQLIATTTRLLPRRTRLRSLGLAREAAEPVVRFTVLGSDEQSTEEFLRNLEDSADFRDVIILSQGSERSGTVGEEVVVTCTARYMGGVLSRSR